MKTRLELACALVLAITTDVTTKDIENACEIADRLFAEAERRNWPEIKAARAEAGVQRERAKAAIKALLDPATP